MPLPIALAVMTAGDLRMECVEGIGASISDQTVSQFWITRSGPYLDNGRNDVVRTFNDPRVRERCTHLLMVDSDVSFTTQDVSDLYEAAEDRAVVSGIYYSIYDAKPKPVIYDWTTNELGQKTLAVIDKWEDDYPMWPSSDPVGDQDPLVRVEAAGAGFLMIRYEVIDVLAEVFEEPQPWFTEPVIDGIHYGEDLAFCMRVKDAGFSVWAHRGVELVHHKMINLGSRVVA